MESAVKYEDLLTFRGCGFEFLKSTSIHGIRRIGFSKTTVGKVSWSILTVVASILALWALVVIVLEYRDYPVRNKVSRQIERMKFPAVTFCNLNPIRTREIEPSVLSVMKEFREDANFSARPPGDPSPMYIMHRLYADRLRKFSLEERQAAGHLLKKMVLHCSWNGRECDIDRDFTTVYNDKYGNCYTFNGGRYTKGNIARVKTSVHPGSLHGLSLILNPQQKWYSPSYSPAVGVRVMIHPNFYMPFPEDSGFNLTPGKEASVSIDTTHYSRLPRPHGSCSDQLTNEYDYKYSSGACLKICKQESLMTDCMCGDPSLPLKKNEKICDLLNIDKVENRDPQCHNQVMMKYENKEYECSCQEPCEEDIFNMDYSLTHWPSESHKEFYQKMLWPVESLTYQMSDLVSIKLYYSELSKTVIANEAVYTVQDLLAQLGGLSALILGISFLSLIELGEYLFTMMTIPWVPYSRWPGDELHAAETSPEVPEAVGNDDDRPVTASNVNADLDQLIEEEEMNARPLPNAVKAKKVGMSS